MARLCFCFFSLGLVGKDLAWDPDAVLERAGQNRFEISQALDRIPASQRAGLRFLLTHMPESDLQSLSSGFLLENVDYAYRAWKESPWKSQVSEQLFFNQILPYASINERRDAWRRSFYERLKRWFAAWTRRGLRLLG